MENTPEAAGAAQAPQTEAKPITNSTTAPAQVQTSSPAAPDMHGFTSDQLADMKKFFEANGGFDKIKARISNPEPIHKIDQTPTQAAQPQAQPGQPATYRAPIGSITREEFLAQQYFNALAHEEKYAPIAKEVESGAVLKDMAAFNIRPINQDGSINDAMVRRYLDLKAQTVAAKATSTAPEASSAPTVDYAPYDEKNMSMQQAVAILQQDSALKNRGQAGHPHMKEAEEFMRNFLNKGKK